MRPRQDDVATSVPIVVTQTNASPREARLQELALAGVPGLPLGNGIEVAGISDYRGHGFQLFQLAGHSSCHPDSSVTVGRSADAFILGLQ